MEERKSVMKRLTSLFLVFTLLISTAPAFAAQKSLIRGRCNITLNNAPPPSPELIPENILEDFESGKLPERITKNGAIGIVKDVNNSENSVLAINGIGSITIDENWRNFVLETDVTFTDYGFVQWSFRKAEANSTLNMYYVLMYCIDGTSYFSIRKRVNGVETILTQLAYSMSLRTKYNVKISVKNDIIELYANGKMFLNASDTSFSSGAITIGSAHWNVNVGAQLDNLAITALPYVKIESVTTDQPDFTIAVGETIRLPMDIQPIDADNKAITIRTDDYRVIGIGDYTITGLIPGEANVTAITECGKFELNYHVKVVQKTFDDIGNHWSKRDVEKLINRGVLKTEDANFYPDRNVNRADFIEMITNMIGYDLVSYKNSFTDVSESSPYAKILETAKQAGLIPTDFIIDGAILPNADITREEAFVLLVKAYEIATGMRAPEGDYTGYVDYTGVSSYALPFIAAAGALDIIGKVGTINPKGTVSRGYAAQLLVKTLAKIDETGALPVVPLDVEIERPREKNGVVVSVADFGAKTFDPSIPNNPDKFDNYDAFVAALEYCKQVNASKLIIPTGHYYFNTPKRLEIRGFTDFTIDGQGSELILGQVTQFMYFANNTRFEFKNVIVDWDWEKSRIADLVKVINKDSANSWFDLEYISVDKVDASKAKLTSLTAVDPVTYAWGRDGGKDYSLSNRLVENVAPNVLRVYPNNPASISAMNVGDTFIIRYYTYEGHTFPCFSNKDFTIDNVTIYSGIGHGFSMYKDMENWQIINTTIGKRPGYEITHPISTATDGIHIGQQKGHYRIENCSISYQGDDGINLHENFSQGIRYLKDDPYTIIATRADWSNPIDEGDIIEFRNPDLSYTGFRAKVVSREYLDSEKSIKVTFDRKVPSNLPLKCLLFNKRYNGSWGIIRNNTFSCNRARGLLLKGSHILVEDNTFKDIQSSAMMIELELSQSWTEGPLSNQIIIRNNTFENCDVSEWEGTTINISASLPNLTTDYPVNRNILIENNRFINPNGRILRIESFDNITVRHNSVTGLKQRAYPPRADRGVIDAKLGKNLFIYENEYEFSPYLATELVKIDAATVRGKVETYNNKVQN